MRTIAVTGALVLAAGSCVQPPVGVFFRCEADRTCPGNLRCEAIGSDWYCVTSDGGLGGGGAGGRAGGSAAGGMAGGGIGGGVGGGSVAGGMAGGDVAGGVAGGGMAGGDVAGGVAGGGTAGGGIAGGVAGGGTAGGGIAGGVAAGGTAGGMTGGGASGGGMPGGGVSGGGMSGGAATGGGMTGGGTAGGGAAGGTAGGASGGTAGGAGPFVTDGGLAFPSSRFVAIAGVAVSPSSTAPAIATIREPLDASVSLLESWTASLSPRQSRTYAWSSFRPEQLSSNRNGVTAVGGRSGLVLSFSHVDPANAFADLSMGAALVVSPATRLVRMRALLGSGGSGGGLLAPIVVMLDGDPTSEVGLWRLLPTASVPAVIRSTAGSLARGDDVLELPGDVLALLTPCDGNCSFGVFMNDPGVTGQVLRFGTLPFTPSATNLGMATRFDPILQAPSVPSYATQAPVRLVTDGNQYLYMVGETFGGGPLRIERRSLSSSVRNSFWISTNRITVVDAVRSPVADTVLVLATVDQGGVALGDAGVAWTPGNQSNVALIRINTSPTPIHVTTWDLPGDQRAVGLTTTIVGSDYRVIIVGNEGTTGFMWNVPHPP